MRKTYAYNSIVFGVLLGIIVYLSTESVALTALAVGVIIGVHKAKNIRALRNDGTIMKRDMDYAEKGEQFTSKIGSVPALKDELLKAQLPCDTGGDLTGAVFCPECGVRFSANNN